MGGRNLSGAGGEPSPDGGRQRKKAGGEGVAGHPGSVGADGLLYPRAVLADLRVDSWMLGGAAGVNAP